MNYMTALQKEDLRASDFKEAVTAASISLDKDEFYAAKEDINERFKMYLRSRWYNLPNKYFDVVCEHSKSASFISFENKFRDNVSLLKDALSC